MGKVGIEQELTQNVQAVPCKRDRIKPLIWPPQHLVIQCTAQPLALQEVHQFALVAVEQDGFIDTKTIFESCSIRVPYKQLSHLSQNYFRNARSSSYHRAWACNKPPAHGCGLTGHQRQGRGWLQGPWMDWPDGKSQQSGRSRSPRPDRILSRCSGGKLPPCTVRKRLHSDPARSAACGRPATFQTGQIQQAGQYRADLSGCVHRLPSRTVHIR